MSRPVHCPTCGAPLPEANTPCPRCLMAVGLAERAGPRLGPGFLDDLPLTGEALLIAGRYRVLEIIGRGGMGVVYKARQENLDRLVAVKVLAGGAHADEPFKQRFAQEAKAAAALQHPNIVTLHDWGEDCGQPFLVMEYVEGQSLAERLAAGPFAPAEAARLIEAVSRAVHYAHQQGILHRDLKPANILLAPDRTPKITDFGLARRLDTAPDLTRTGQTLGSPGFLPPEQISARHGPACAASDVYGLGATLYCLLTGRPPFAAETLAATLAQVERADPPPPRRLNRAVPRDLEVICLKCLEKDPARRYASALDLAEDLANWRAGRPIRARPAGHLQRAWKWARRQPAAALAAGLLLAAGVAVAAVLKQRHVLRTAHTQAAIRLQREQAARQQAEAEARRVQPVRSAESRFARHLASEGVAVLAAELRRNPSKTMAGARLLSALIHRRWPLAVGKLSESQPVLTWSSDGRQVATGDGRSTQDFVWSFDHEPTPVWTAPRNGLPQCAVFSPDNRRLFLSSEYTPGRVWDTATGQALAELQWKERVQHAAFSADGRRLLTLCPDFSVYCWDAASGQRLAGPLAHPAALDAALLSPDGRWALTECEGQVRLWEVDTGRLALGPVPARGDAVRRSRLKAQPGVPVPEGITLHPCARFSPDGRWLLLWNQRAELYELASGRLLSSILPPQSGPGSGTSDLINLAVFSPDGRRLALATDSGWAGAWDALSGQPLFPPIRHPARVNAVAFSPDGDRLATACHSGSARVWDAATGQPLSAPLRHGAPVLAAEFSADGRWLATADHDWFARVWDPRTGRRLFEPILHPRPLLGARFSPDNRMLMPFQWGRPYLPALLSFAEPVFRVAGGPAVATPAAAKTNGGWTLAITGATVRVLETQSGLPVTEPLNHPRPVVAAAFSADGCWLETRTDDGAAWRCELPRLTGPAPRWLPDAADIIGGLHLDGDGRLTRVRLLGLWRLREIVANAKPDDLPRRWLTWLLANPRRRTMSPSSDLSVPDYIRQRLEENTEESLHAVLNLAADHGPAMARLAWLALEKDRATNRAEFLSRRAVELAPADPEVQRLRAAILQRLGRPQRPP